MTPCEELGYKVGDKFEATVSATFSEGSLIELYMDDGTNAPAFKLISGSCAFEIKKDILGAYYYLGYARPLKSSEKTIENNYPTFDFKINLSNMSDAEKKVAKEWLVDVAKSRGIRKGALAYDRNFYWLEVDCSSTVCSVADDKYDYYKGESTPELFLTFSAPTITSWEAPEASPKKTEKECQRLLQLEELVDKLKSQLEEAQKQLEDINSK